MPASHPKPSLRRGVDELAYLNALPSAVLAVDSNLQVTFFNQAAEMMSLFALPASLDALVKRVFAEAADISLYEQTINDVGANLHLTPVVNAQFQVEEVLITVEKTQAMHAEAASEWKKKSTHAAGVMAAMLAHEVKNPLSGIRGAAQLLKDEMDEEHKPLADLICMETDRIRDLLNQMEIFTAGAPADMQPVNIHEVLHYVLSVAKTGFAQHATIQEKYDPSLPEVMANRDLLVQLFLNLVKNAAEAGTEIMITTSYHIGYRIRPENGRALPVMVSIVDNGPGIPEAMRDRLFEPFASSKEEGRGLGLAVVAKIATDLGIVVEFDQNTAKGARFNVMLATAS